MKARGGESKKFDIRGEKLESVVREEIEKGSDVSESESKIHLTVYTVQTTNQLVTLTAQCRVILPNITSPCRVLTGRHLQSNSNFI